MPTSTMNVGPSGSGKTQLTEALLTEGTVFEGRKTPPCHYCYAVWQPRFDGMKRQGIQFREGIPEVADLQTWFPQGGVLVLDDLMDEGGISLRENPIIDTLRSCTGVKICFHLGNLPRPFRAMRIT